MFLLSYPCPRDSRLCASFKNSSNVSPRVFYIIWSCATTEATHGVLRSRDHRRRLGLRDLCLSVLLSARDLCQEDPDAIVSILHGGYSLPTTVTSLFSAIKRNT